MKSMLVFFSWQMNSEVVLQTLHRAISLIEEGMNAALEMFNSCIKKQAEPLKKRIKINDKCKNDDWYDQECTNSKRSARNLLRKYRQTLTEEDCSKYCKERKEYKCIMKSKKKAYNENLVKSLVCSVNNQHEFWKNVHKISGKKSIAANEWSVNGFNILNICSRQTP